MTHSILDEEHGHVLAGFALANVLLALDYDGTLAPIAPEPDEASMRAETRALLIDVAHLYPCIVISGRALDDVAGRVHGVPLWHVFGNHGLEPAPPEVPYAALVHSWVSRLQEVLPALPGVTVEDKKHSITLHYRHAADKARALDAITQAVRQLPEARPLGGTDAVSVLPPGGTDKGTALQQARRRFACDTAIYVGDDDTDETAFASDTATRLLGIRVGVAPDSHARFHLPSQEDIDGFLQMLIALRTPADGSIRPARRRPID